MKSQLDSINRSHGHDPQALIDWGLGLGKNSLITTNFGPFSTVLLHMLTRARPDIPVLWIDSGYATPATYQFADEVAKLLKLNLHIYHPLRSRAHREAADGPAPDLNDPTHAAFTREVKLEPFERATRELAPEVWFTAIRADQTAERAAMQPVTLNKDGIIKIAPVLGWTAKDMHLYLKQHGLPNNFDYFDPTKVEAHRECGLHTAH